MAALREGYRVSLDGFSVRSTVEPDFREFKVIYFRVAGELTGDFLMTYDDAEEARALAQMHEFDMLTVSMQNTHLAKMKELLVGRNLDWAR